MIKTSIKALLIAGVLLGGATLSAGEDAKKSEEKKEVKIDPAAEKAALTLFETLKMQDVLKKSLQNGLEVQLKRQPAMVPYKDIYEKFFSKYADWNTIKKELAKLYATTFTADELKKMNDFYSTEYGKKSMVLVPRSFTVALNIAKKLIAEHSEELKKEVEKRAEKIDSAVKKEKSK